MDRSTGDRSPQRLSRRALLGWGVGAGCLVAAGGAYVLAPRLLSALASLRITELYTYHGHTRGVRALAWSPDGARLASASFDKTVQVWESATGQRLLAYTGHAQAPASVSWSPDSTRLVSAGNEGSLQVWRAADSALLWSYQDHAYDPASPNGAPGVYFLNVAWAPEGGRIATVGFPMRVANEPTMTTLWANTTLWAATTGQRLLQFGDEFSQRVAWAPESARLATGGVEQTVTVYSTPPAPGGTSSAAATPSVPADQSAGASEPSPATIWGYHGDIAYVQGLAWSPDGTRIASCGDKPSILFASNGGVRIWDAATGRRVLTYTGHDESVDLRALAWSPDGRYLASGGTDQIVRLWDAHTGQDLATYYGHLQQPRLNDLAYPYAITAIAWSPDSTRLATSAISGPIRVWRLSA